MIKHKTASLYLHPAAHKKQQQQQKTTTTTTKNCKA